MSKVYMQDGRLIVPDCVTVPFIEGDGVGAEITPVCQQIVNEAVKLATVVNAPSNGKKCWQVEKHSNRPVNGCRKLRWMLSVNI